ncbi:MAG: ATPase domain-containing protein [Nitrososphaerota archaeon]|nr:AAA family ATPase [Candidatus Bathyarchaeota archaeon]MDW8048942.1 ATPase domain-containing protein [Nitrososphaerota archaeon]
MPQERVQTGIDGFDGLIEGGLPRGYCYAIVGGPGTGKTTFAVQFICTGILRFGENGIYVTLEEPPYSIANSALRYGWNMYDLEEKRRLAIVDASPIRAEGQQGRYVIKAGIGTEEFSVDGLIGAINDARRKIEAKRCVVDSVSALQIQYRDEFESRQGLLRLVKALTEMRLTTLLLVESREENPNMQRYGTEEFLAHGVIHLHSYRIRDSIVRAVEVRKMRGVKITDRICPYDFTSNGIIVYPGESVFAE